MAARRLYWAASVLACGMVYIANGERLSWLLFVFTAGLPLLSLVLSLPAILGFRLSTAGESRLTVGQPGELLLMGSCAAPMPPFRGRIRLTGCFTGQITDSLDTRHCGGWTAEVTRGRVCDYLGIFAFPVRRTQSRTILVRPEALAVAVPDMEKFTARSWHPKPGGGFAENHELRDFRPGDSMNGVHWKLSAKTGSLMVREPVEPEQGRILLTMTLRGTPEELDRKLGRFLWLGRWLLEQELNFELRVLTAEGVETMTVRDAQELNRALDALLCRPAAEAGTIQDFACSAFWQYHIGGEPDEA